MGEGIGEREQSEDGSRRAQWVPERLKALARRMRQEPTWAEELLWHKLRRNQLRGYKFNRQHPLGRYIADFYCAELRLVIEIDGEVHDTERQREYDSIRTQELEGRRLTVLRFRNEEVAEDINQVLRAILLRLPARDAAAQPD